MPICANCKFAVEDWMSVCPRCRTPVPRPSKGEREKGLASIGAGDQPYSRPDPWLTPPPPAAAGGPPPRVASGKPLEMKVIPPREEWERAKKGPAIMWPLAAAGLLLVASALYSVANAGARYRLPLALKPPGLYLFIGAMACALCLFFLRGLGQKLTPLYALAVGYFLFENLALDGHTVRFYIHAAFLVMVLLLVVGYVGPRRLVWCGILAAATLLVALGFEHFRAAKPAGAFKAAEEHWSETRYKEAAETIQAVIDDAGLWEYPPEIVVRALYAKAVFLSRAGDGDAAAAIKEAVMKAEEAIEKAGQSGETVELQEILARCREADRDIQWGQSVDYRPPAP